MGVFEHPATLFLEDLYTTKNDFGKMRACLRSWCEQALSGANRKEFSQPAEAPAD
jgi:hypothetical protein